MQIVIQAVESRRKQVEKIQSVFKDAIASYDDSGTPIGGFKKALNIPIDSDYRLHFQDDIVLAHNIDKYLPLLEKEIADKNIMCLGLFSPNQNAINNADIDKKFFHINTDRLWIQAVILHKSIIELARERIEATSEKKHDDVFLRKCIRELKYDVYVHIPGIVQHNVWLKSVVGHINSRRRMSKVFDMNYIKNNYNL
jgi:hypothetical protein